MADRRTFLGTIAGAGIAASGLARGAPAPAVRRIGFLVLAATSPGNFPSAVLKQALAELGYVDGRTVEFVARTAGGRPDRLPALAAELVTMRVDAIVSVASEATRAAKLATSAIPIVFVGPSYPIEEGLIASFARPGGNVTGFTLANSDHVAKHVQLLRDVVPQVADVGVLWSPANPGNVFHLRDTRAAAEGLGIRIRSLQVEKPEDLDQALADLERSRPEAMILLPTPFMNANAQRIADAVTRLRIPATSAQRVFADRGFLFAYGADFSEMERKVAVYLDRILKGAKPGDLPVERPSRYVLVINLKAARSLGLAVPSSLLLRADEVIR